MTPKGKEASGEIYIPWSSKKNLVPIIEKSRQWLRNMLNLQEKNPKLETNNYKIDSDMSVKEKLANWRKKVNWRMYYMPDGEDMEHIAITMLVKNLWSWAYVIEHISNDAYPDGKQPKNWSYVDRGMLNSFAEMKFIPVRYDSDISDALIWTQKFNYAAAKKLGLIKRMPRDFETFKKACGDKNPADVIEPRPSDDWKTHFAGTVNLWKEYNGTPYSCSDIDNGEFFLLWNGEGAFCNEDTIAGSNMPPMTAASIRLLKKSNKHQSKELKD